MSRQVLERLRADKKLLLANRITEEELNFLETVGLFGTLKSVSDILFILKNIRDPRPDGKETDS